MRRDVGAKLRGEGSGWIAVTALATLAGACVEERSFRPPDAVPPVPTVPVLRLPQNDAYEGSTVLGRLQPTFAWEASTVDQGEVRYELQYSADKTFPAGTPTEAVSATSFKPAAPLAVSTTPPVGRRYYWRVRACAGEACSEYSKPWWVNLGRSIKDFNGDGYDDVVVGGHHNSDNGSQAGRANIYFGSPGQTFDAAVDGSVADSAAGDWFGSAVAAAGDFNGDGFGDVLVGAQFSDRKGPDSGAAYLYFGGAGQALNTQVDVIFEGTQTLDYLGGSVMSGGDLNGDGLSEILISSSLSDRNERVGCVNVFAGSEIGGGRVAQPTSKICGSGESLMLKVRGVGDLNGDGFGDVVISSSLLAVDGQMRKCAAAAYFGGVGTGLDATSDGVFAGEPNDICTLTIEKAGDVNADGYSDVIGVATESGRSVRLFLGGKTVDSKVDMVFNAQPPNGTIFRAVAAGDMNGDGVDDVVFTAREEFDNKLYVHLGKEGAAGLPLSSSPALQLSGATGSGFAYSLAGAGDLNGDGYDDLILGNPIDNDSTGRADFFYGNGGGSIDMTANGFITSGQFMSRLGLEVAQQVRKDRGRTSAARRANRY